jgi:hypothetical protein
LESTGKVAALPAVSGGHSLTLQHPLSRQIPNLL